MVAKAQVASYHPTRLWRQYNRALSTSPIATKSLTCMACYALGDTVAQLATSNAPTLERRLLSLDVARTARLALFGLLWTGPSGHAFYRWLDKAFHALSFGRVLSVAGKVGVDQLCYSPLCTMVFFAWVNASCFTPENIPADISKKLFPSTQASWSLWVPCMLFNMALVPAKLRMLFINVISLFWTYKLSTLSNSSTEAEILPLPQQELSVDCGQVSVCDILGEIQDQSNVNLAEAVPVALSVPLLESHEVVFIGNNDCQGNYEHESNETELSIEIPEGVTVALV